MLDRGTILVTGGSGFIGSALIWALNQLGHERILVAAKQRLRDAGRFATLSPLRFLRYLLLKTLLFLRCYSRVKTPSSILRTNNGRVVR